MKKELFVIAENCPRVAVDDAIAFTAEMS